MEQQFQENSADRDSNGHRRTALNITSLRGKTVGVLYPATVARTVTPQKAQKSADNV